MRLIEIHEQAWFPNFLRDYVTDGLQFIFRVGGVYRNITPRLISAFKFCGTTCVLDLCSGAGGPWLWLCQQIREHVASTFTVILTDKYPSTGILRDAFANQKCSLIYYSESVDATCVPETIHGFRTMFSSFHHFSRTDAIGILQNAADHGEGIGIFEAAQPRLRTILLTTLVLAGCLATAPFLKPFRLSRLFWTYAVPVVPLVLFFDGVVSCLRAHSLEQLSEIVGNVNAKGYEWDIGEDTRGLVPINYLLGWPHEKTSRKARFL